MSSMTTTAKLYAHVAMLRRRVLLKHSVNRALLAVFAAMLLLVGIALLNVALFLALRGPFGDIGSVLVVAVTHLLIGAAALFVTLQEPTSPELDALAAAETAAFEAMSKDMSGTIDGLVAAGDRLQHLANTASLSLAAASGIRSLVSGSNGHAPEHKVPTAK